MLTDWVLRILLAVDGLGTIKILIAVDGLGTPNTCCCWRIWYS